MTHTRRRSGPAMVPADGEARWQVLPEQALVDEALDHAVLIFIEAGKRPEDKPWNRPLEVERCVISRSLDRLEQRLNELGGWMDLGTVGIADALDYLDLRGAVGEWRDRRSQLTAWFEKFARRPSMTATATPA